MGRRWLCGGAEGGKGSRETVWSIDWNNGTYSCGKDGEVSANGAQSCEGCDGTTYPTE